VNWYQRCDWGMGYDYESVYASRHHTQ